MCQPSAIDEPFEAQPLGASELSGAVAWRKAHERSDFHEADMTMYVRVNVFSDPVDYRVWKDAAVFMPVRRIPTEEFDESQDKCPSRDLGTHIGRHPAACGTGKPHHAVSKHRIFARQEMRVIAWHIRLIRSGKIDQLPTGYFYEIRTRRSLS
jgi:hypothetical protein